jgi:hypothetical protein
MLSLVLLLIFGFQKNEKLQKNIYIKKIFGRNPKNNRSEKKMLECRKKAKIG